MFKIIHDKYAIYARISLISSMHDTITKLTYTSRNLLNFAYTDEILFGSVCIAYFLSSKSMKMTMIIVDLIGNYPVQKCSKFEVKL